MADAGVAKKLSRIADCLDRIESGKHSDLSISQCCDYIGWVAKFKKAPRAAWEPLCDKATKILKSGIY